MSATSFEYNVLRFDADSTDEDLNKGLAPLGHDGWKIASTYHLHHLNAVVYVLYREASSTK